jgi:zinc protease
MRRWLAAVLLAVAAWWLSAPAHAVEIKELTTPLGIKAWLVEDRSVPVVTLSFSFAGGAALEPANEKGVTNLMATLLTDGAGPLDAQAFSQRQQDASASLGFGASQDRLGGSLRVLSANRDEGFELLRLALSQPRFGADMVERRRAQVIAGLNQAAQRPASVAERTLATTVFANHPYAASPQGERESLQNLKVEDLKARVASALDRTGLVVAAVGDIDEAELARLLDHSFGTLPAGTAKMLPPEWIPPSLSRLLVVERPVPQSAVRIAMPGVRRDDPDWYAALVMAHILGGAGPQSRLFTEVRDKRGLAYSVSAGLRPYKKASLLTISTASANERVPETIRVIRATLARLRAEGVTDQELADAKTYLGGSLPVSLDSSSSIAGLLHSMQVDGLPREYLDRRASLIGAVRLEDVRRLAGRLLRDDMITTVVVGKPVGLVSDPQQ